MSFVRFEQLGAVAKLTIDRPEKKNAIHRALYHELAELFTKLQTRSDIRCVLLCGQDDIFSAGNDLADFVDADDSCLDHVLIFMKALYALEKPVVASVKGAAVGIGATLLLHCDLVYGGESAWLSYPFVQLGACPEFGSSQLMPALLGRQRASALLLLGQRVSAAQALSMGLFNEVIDDAEVDAFALDRAQQLATFHPAAVQATKSLLQGDSGSLSEVFEQEAREFVRLVQMPEAQKIIRKMVAGK